MIKPLKMINVRVPGQIEKELRSISRKKKIPISDLVRESLQEYLAVRKFLTLRKEIMPEAAKHGFLTDEDVFKSVS